MFSIIFVSETVNKIERILLTDVPTQELADEITAALVKQGLVTRAWSTPKGVNDGPVPEGRF